MRRLACLIFALFAWFVVPSLAIGGDVGFEEDFALALDRAATLKQLVPGTEYYYYYHCLHYQTSGQLDEAERMLARWVARDERRGKTALMREIERRQALLRYNARPQQTLDFLRRELGLHFRHERDRLDRQRDLASRLDPQSISHETLTRRAMHRRGDLRGFEDSRLWDLAARQLSASQRRELLSRLTTPDLPNLLDLIVADLNYRRTSGFGSIPIHTKLARAQLDALLRRKGDLRNNGQLVMAYLARLRPGPEVDWRDDPKAKRAYYQDQWQFARTLGPVHNSLKANVLYHLLDVDRSMGRYDRDLFLEYLKIPRPVFYVAPRLLETDEGRRHRANLGAHFTQVAPLPPIGADEPLVRDYLLTFFADDDSHKRYTPYIRESYLEKVFAEAKILAGKGDPERWASMLTPAEFKALRERVDLIFKATNEQVFDPDEKVTLTLKVKNASSLVVKVYEINTFNYYRTQHREVTTDVNLEGLVPNRQFTVDYDDVENDPFVRKERSIELADLTGRGVWVVEVLGGNKASRALIRKGRLRHLQRPTLAGHRFAVLDEQGRPLDDAAIWLSGHRYEAEDDGWIIVPFSTKPSSQEVLLLSGEFASLASFTHRGEQPDLFGGLYVDREQLLAGRTARLVVRPRLYITGRPARLELLQDVRLTITTTDLDGVSTSKVVDDLTLEDHRESAVEFRVPERTVSLDVSLSGKVELATTGAERELSVSRSFPVNRIAKTDKIQQLLLACYGGQWTLELLGKTGEARPDAAVRVTLKHRDYTQPVHVTLGTDRDGRVHLGELEGIATVQAVTPEGTSRTWSLPADAHYSPAFVRARVGDAVRVPWMVQANRPTREQVALLEMRGGVVVADRFNAVRARGGYLLLDGLPAGDYQLHLKDAGKIVHLSVTAGQAVDGFLAGAHRALEVVDPDRLQIVSVDKTRGGGVTVRLDGAGADARVVVLATRYAPAFDAMSLLGRPPLSSPSSWSFGPAVSQYVSGRKIGDEMRYILERRLAKVFPGNMLQRPGLLLNPWAIRDTSTGKQHAATGEAWGRKSLEGKDGARGGRFFGAAGREQIAPDEGGFATLDFLAEPSAVILNLVPDRDGRIDIPADALSGKQHVHVLAMDAHNSVYRSACLAETHSPKRDLRLRGGLDPSKHFAERREVSPVASGEGFAIADRSSSEWQAVDSLAKAHALLLTLTNDATLREFSFVLDWPTYDQAKKRELYSKYACHELHLFLYHKDPEFFREIVKPYLANKKDKTFLDHWLLGEDVSDFRTPWAYGRLNVAERVLLARRIAGELPHTARHIGDLFDLLPPQPQRDLLGFRTALGLSGLETDGRPGKESRDEYFDADRGLAPVDDEARPATAPGRGVPEPLARRRQAAEGAAEELEETAKSQTNTRRSDLDESDGLALSARLLASRKKVRRLYRKLEATKEWAENNYYHLPIEQQNAELIPVNAFWNDYAHHDGDGPFLSPHLAAAAGSFAEMMLALAVTDLPFEAPDHGVSFLQGGMQLQAAGNLLMVHKQIQPADAPDGKTPILVSQNVFRHGERYETVDGERRDKFVTDEFLTHVVYGMQVVVTNPTSSRRRLTVLTQIPRGALPVGGAKETDTRLVQLDPYNTKTFDVHFYFPAEGDYEQFPVHVAQDGKLVAAAKATTYHVVTEPSKVDTTSWEHVSQHGDQQAVLGYLRDHNLHDLNLERIAWRMKDRGFFETVMELLRRRHAYSHTLWSYAIMHNDQRAIREYLRHADGFVAGCGKVLRSPLLEIDPVERKAYQHLEYSPLVNARRHKLGQRWTIVNDRFFQQYQAFLGVLRYVPELDDEYRLSAVYYLLLQDRVADALGHFEKVDRDALPTKLQYDYMQAYLSFYTERLNVARQIARRYADHKVDRWRKVFAEVASQLDEIQGRDGPPTPPTARGARPTWPRPPRAWTSTSRPGRSRWHTATSKR